MNRYAIHLLLIMFSCFSVHCLAQSDGSDIPLELALPADVISAPAEAATQAAKIVSAGGRNWAVRMYSKKDGMAGDSAVAISTMDGLPFIGTESGMCDFDGKEWRVYPENLGFPTGTVHFVLVLEDIGAMAIDNGFRLYYQNYMWDLDLGTKGTSAAALRGGIFFGADNGLYKVGDKEIKDKGFSPVTSMGGKGIRALAAGGPEALWAAATDGIYLLLNEAVTMKYPLPAYFDPAQNAAFAAEPSPASTGTAYIQIPPDSLKIPGPIGGSVTGMYVDAVGVVWTTTDKGINRFDPWTDEWRIVTCADGSGKINCANATAISVAGRRLWIGTPGGAAMWDGSQWTFFSGPDFLPDDRVISLAATYTGGAWIGAQRGAAWIAPEGESIKE